MRTTTSPTIRSIFLVFSLPLVFLQWACGDDATTRNSGDGGTSDSGDSLVDAAVNGGDGGTCHDACDVPGALRCSGSRLEICADDSAGCYTWNLQQDCAANSQVCDDANGQPACVTPETCQDGIRNQDETDIDCGGTCAPCPEGAGCSGDDDCASGLCRNGVCLLCEPGQYRCRGNSLQVCSNDGQSWSEQDHCDFPAGEICDADAGRCGHPDPVGDAPPDTTGVYYQFAYFTQANAPIQCNQCVWDVDSLGDLIFVNRGMMTSDPGIDVYQVTLLDSDGDGKLEPNQHPDNPDNPGPIEERQLTFVTHYSVAIGGQHINEIYATDDVLYWLKGGNPGDGIWSYDIATGATTQVVPPPPHMDWAPTYGIQVLGYDEVRDLWFGATGDRDVLQYDPATGEWSLEFIYPNLAGTHGDGMEVVVDPHSGIPYVYLSDMTSDYIAQYEEDDQGRWHQVNLFEYDQPQQKDVEGMGFGALHHFWMAGRDALYEVGGGDLAQYTDPTHQI